MEGYPEQIATKMILPLCISVRYRFHHIKSQARFWWERNTTADSNGATTHVLRGTTREK